MPKPAPNRVRFGEFELNLDTGELAGNGGTVRLGEKPLRILVSLIEQGGQLVTREDLQKRLWQDDTFVDFEHGINTAIKLLRKTLGDSAEAPRYIDTIPRRGYRLMLPVEWINIAGNEIAADAGTRRAPSPESPQGWPRISTLASPPEEFSDKKPRLREPVAVSQPVIDPLLCEAPTDRRQPAEHGKDSPLDASGNSEPLPSPALIRSHLERVLHSPGFRASASICKLLRYTVEAVLGNNERNLKEYVIGLEVFDRGQHFDPGNDAIVRVLARKLRDKLDDYYQNEGVCDTMQIEFAKGGYVPSFTVRRASVPRTIVVLPFINLSPENDSSYFADGLTEELMHALIPIRELRVVARTSAFQFRNSSQDIRQIGRSLNAELILEGSVRLAGSQVRITARLESAVDGTQLWSGRYDRRLEELFQIQDEIARAIATTIKQTVSSFESSSAKSNPAPAAPGGNAAIDLEVMKLYLKGRYFWNLRTAAGFRKSVECYQQAITCQPRFSRANAGLADAYLLMMMHNLGNPRKLMSNARAAAVAALETAPESSQAHCSLAALHVLADWNWADAEAEFQRSIEIDPNYATAYHWRAMFCDIPQGRLDRALADIGKAEQLEPFSLPIVSDFGYVFYMSRRYEEAEAQCNAAIEISPSFYRTHIVLGRLYAAQQRYEKALAHLNRAFESMDGDAFRSQALGTLGFLYGRLGNREQTANTVAELEALDRRSFASPIDRAIVAVGAGDLDEALRHLTEAVHEKVGFLIFLGHEPLLDDLRPDPRFQRLSEGIFPPTVN